MSRPRHWTIPSAPTLRLTFLGAVSALSIAIIAYLLTEVRGKLNELASSPADNMQWTLSQLEVEFLEFGRRIDQAQRGPDSAALNALRRRYDILYSRFDTLASSALYQPALHSPQMDGRFEAAKLAIFALARFIDGEDRALRAALPAIRTEVEAMRPDIRRVLTIGNQVLVDQSDAARADVARVLYWLAIAAFVLIAALSLLILMFRQVAAASHQRAVEIERTSSRLATIFAASRDAILLLTRSGRVETANTAAEAMFGGPLRDMPIAKLLSQMEGTRDRPVSADELRELAGQVDRMSHRMFGHNRDGRRFPVALSLDATDRRGSQAMVCVIRDITDQVAAEQELVISRDKALAGERAKARFLGIVSHEMRTPLNGILGTVDLMQEEGSSDARERYLPIIEESGRALLDLVNDVLDITRIEGAVAPAPAAFDLDEMIAKLMQSEKFRALEKNLSLDLLLPAPLGHVMGDERRLRQILLNLLNNALKFTDEGYVTLSAERRRDGMVEFQVADTGMGIADHELSAVFDDFVRTDAAMARQIQGTGLGLGIARSLARAMKGDITADSVEGEGSMFTLTLPLPPCDPPEASAIPEKTPLPARTPPLRILLVEDNATNRFVARQMLERHGHKVTEAHDGEQALDAGGKDLFDLILMDVSMPVLDGVEATRRLRAGDGPNRATRVIALTAHIGEEIADALREAGLDGMISKPLSSRDLSRLFVEPGGFNLVAGRDPTVPVLDETRRRDLRRIAGPDRAAAMEAEFLRDGAAIFDDAAQGMRPSGDAVHRLAGSAAVMGAEKLRQALLSLETTDAGAPEFARARAAADETWRETRARFETAPLADAT